MARACSLMSAVIKCRKVKQADTYFQFMLQGNNLKKKKKKKKPQLYFPDY
jgi:hypothetical protein